MLVRSCPFLTLCTVMTWGGCNVDDTQVEAGRRNLFTCENDTEKDRRDACRLAMADTQAAILGDFVVQLLTGEHLFNHVSDEGLSNWMFPYEYPEIGADVMAMATELIDSNYLLSSFPSLDLHDFFAQQAALAIAPIFVTSSARALKNLPNCGSNPEDANPALWTCDPLEVLQQTLLDDPRNTGCSTGTLLRDVPRPSCRGYVNDFGEMISAQCPFELDDDSAGRTSSDGCFFETVTTLPISYVTHDANAPFGDVLLPTYLLPLYQRYLTQHEFGHVVQLNAQIWRNKKGTHYYPFIPRDIFCPPLETDNPTQDYVTLDEAIRFLYAEAQRKCLFMTCYASQTEHEFWAEASAAYFSPVPIGAANGGPGNEPFGGQPCSVGITEEAKAKRRGWIGLTMSGAEWVGAMRPDAGETFCENPQGQGEDYIESRKCIDPNSDRLRQQMLPSNLYLLLEYLYGPAPAFTLAGRG